MNEGVQQILIAMLGGGALSAIVSAVLNHRRDVGNREIKKDAKAFSVLEGRIRHLEIEMADLKTELKMKNELVDTLKEENIKLKYENEDLKEELQKLKGETENG
ncbi:hypothetical protein [Enterococcus larvae]|uniref:hypothetical protein n=1 Tax=Enterococcus larvae TaxID=2794352 RepID=UPI003F394221